MTANEETCRDNYMHVGKSFTIDVELTYKLRAIAQTVGVPESRVINALLVDATAERVAELLGKEQKPQPLFVLRPSADQALACVGQEWTTFQHIATATGQTPGVLMRALGSLQHLGLVECERMPLPGQRHAWGFSKWRKLEPGNTPR